MATPTPPPSFGAGAPPPPSSSSSIPPLSALPPLPSSSSASPASVSAAGAAPAEAHLLTLKVMRLSKPTLAERTPLWWESADLPRATPTVVADTGALLKLSGAPSSTSSTSSTTSISAAAFKRALPESGAPPPLLSSTSTSASAPTAMATTTSTPTVDRRNVFHWDLDRANELFAVTPMMRLPQSFGSIFLGETFSSFLCINNESGLTVRDVAIKAELQTTSQRFALVDTADKPRPELRPGENIDVVVSHEIKELGAHILVCTVHYTAGRDEKKFFRKFFKFAVANPLAVKTKVYSIRGNVLLEAQVQNATPRVMFLETVRFEAPPFFAATDVTSAPPPGKERRREPPIFLAPKDSRQYLFKLEPLPANRAEARTSTNIGKLDIVWKTTMGERGRLQTSQLSRKVPVLEPVEISLKHTPSPVLLEVPFEVTLEIANGGAQPARFSLSWIKSKLWAVYPVGLTVVPVPELAPHASTTLQITLLAVVPGLQRVVGLMVTDAVSGRTFETDAVGDILVRRGAEPSGHYS